MTELHDDRDWDHLDALVDEDPIALRDAAWRLAVALAAAEHRADEAEARIKAVRDVLDRAEAAINRHPAYTWSGHRMNPIINGADIRRALDGT